MKLIVLLVVITLTGPPGQTRWHGRCLRAFRECRSPAMLLLLMLLLLHASAAAATAAADKNKMCIYQSNF